jgi:uncharacterized protein (DUF2267 family)
MNNLFDHAVLQANVWVKDMMRELGTSEPQKALRALRAGLQALRDRLAVDEAVQLSAQLPLLIRGLFFEGWVPKGKPLRIRHQDEFLDLLLQKYGPDKQAIDGATAHAAKIIQALFQVLGQHVTQGEITNIMLSLPEELTTLVAGRSLDHDDE